MGPSGWGEWSQFKLILSCLRCKHPPRLCWECEAGGLWGQQASADHLHVRHRHALGHRHSLLDEPRGDQW